MRQAAAIAMLLVAAGCSRDPPAPVVIAVQPAVAPTDADTFLTISGEHFVPRVRVDFDRPESSSVDAGFALSLVSAGTRVALADARLVSETQIEARLPAGAAPVGLYDLELVDPRGRRALLAGALAVCSGGRCTAPLACLTAAPASGGAGVTSFGFDASCSSDAQDPTSALQARFLFDLGTFAGAWETAFSTVKTASHVYPTPGVFTAAAEVKNTIGLSDFAYRAVVVSPPGNIVAVTTAHDENDPNATPGSPGGTGLSLREAVSYVNGLAAPQTISFAIPGPGPHRIALGLALPGLTLANAVIAGEPDVTVDCSGVSQPCLTSSGPGQGFVGLVLSGGSGPALQLAAAGYRVAQCTLAATSQATGVVGILATAGGTVGPGNQISGTGVGIEVTGSGVLVDGNRIHGNGTGLMIQGASAFRVQRNFVYGNSKSGIDVSTSTGAVQLNTVDGNVTHGLNVGAQVQLDVRDNLFTNNGGAGVGGGTPTFVPFDHNGFFGNTVPITGGSPGPTDVTADPLYVNSAGGDYRLLPGSPAVNAGVDVGVDVNGPAPGSFNGAAPDLGAWESPY